MKVDLRRYRPRLVFVLLLVSLSFLSVLIGAFLYLNVLENYLLRQTQRLLVTQGEIIGSVYKSSFQRYFPASLSLEGLGRENLAYGVPAASKRIFFYYDHVNDRYSPITSQWKLGPLELDLSRKRFQDEPGLPEAGGPADQFSTKAGQELHAALQDSSRTINSSIQVTDSNGVIISSTDTNLGGSIAYQKEVNHALGGQFVISLHERGKNHEASVLKRMFGETEILVRITMPIVLSNRVLGVIVLSKQSKNTYELIFDNITFVVSSTIVFLALMLLASILVSRVVAGPIRTLIKQTNLIQGGQGEAVQLPLLAPQEVGELFESVASMATKHAMDKKEIDSSTTLEVHNIKNSLWYIKNTATKLHRESKEMPEEVREDFLSKISGELDTLSEQVKRFLEPLAERTSIVAALESVEQYYPHVRLELETDVKTNTLEVTMTSRALVSIVTSLVENSYKHGGEGVSVTISAKTTGPPDMMVQISVSDDGRGISEENVSRIFERHFTTGRQADSSGIGLSTIQALLDVYGGSIELLSGSPGNTIFSVEIPLLGSQ